MVDTGCSTPGEHRDKQVAQAMLDASPGPTILLAQSGTIVKTNAAWRHSDLQSLFDVAGASYFQRLQAAASSLDDSMPEVAEGLRAVMDGRDANTECVLHLHDGSEKRVLEISAGGLSLSGERMMIVAHRDVTERHRMMDALLITKHHLRMLIEQAADGIFVVDQDGQYVDVNASGCRLLGYTREEILGMRVVDVVVDEDLFAQPVMYDELRAGKLVVRDRRLRRKDGEVVSAEVSATQLPDGRFQGIVRDISARKASEIALRESEERSRRLSHAAFEGILIHDQGKLLDANETLASMFGYSQAELLSLDAYMLAAPESRALVRQNVASGYEEPYEAVGIRKDGSVFPVEMAGRGIPYHGRMVRAVAVRDITPRKRVEQVLHDREARLRLVLEQMPAVIWTVDRDLRFTSLGGAAMTSMGVRGDDHVGESLDSFFSADSVRDLLIANHQRAIHGDSMNYAIDWRGHEFQVRLEPLRSEVGQIMGCIGFAYDTTDQKRAAEEIRTRAETERMLLLELDHRIRNNLSSLVSLIDMTRKSSDDVGRFADSIRSRVETMATVHAVLSQRQWQPVRLRSLLGALKVGGSTGTVRLDGPDVDIPAHQVQAVGIVVNELMTNSVKYGALGAIEGQLDLTWQAESREDGTSTVTLRWDESEGPQILQEPQSSVGLSLIQGLVKAELAGRADLTFPPEGVRHRLVIKLTPGPTS